MKAFVARLLAIGAFALTLRPVAAQPAPFPLDILLPMTGPNAFFGQAEAQSAQIYAGLVNASGGIHGRPLRLEVHDDQSNPVIDVQIVNSLLPQHPVAILGPSVTATCEAVLPLFAHGPVDYCFSPAVMPPSGSYVFACAAPLDATFRQFFVRAQALGFRRMAVLISMDASGVVHQKISSDVRASAKGAFKVVAIEEYAPNDISVAAQVARIKAATPDIIYVSAIGPAFQTAMREIDNAGLHVPILTTPANASPAELKQYADVLPKTLVIDGMPYQSQLPEGGLKIASDEFVNAFKAAGVEPTAADAYAWDPLKIVVSALRKLPPNATAAQLRDYLENLHGFAGLWGIYDFRTGDQHGVTGADQPWVRWNQTTATWIPFNGRAADS